MPSPAGVRVGQGTWSWGVSIGSVCWEARGSVHTGSAPGAPPWVTEAGSVCRGDIGHVCEDARWGFTPHLGGSSEQHSFLT